jgi:streptomycin 6-kinase
VDRPARGRVSLCAEMELSSRDYEHALARLRARFGESADRWWATLPSLLGELSDRWALRIDASVRRGNTSLVLRCGRADGSPAMLKLTPEPTLTAAENAALSAWASSGRVPAVWGCDVTLGALLLQAIPTEQPLSERAAPAGCSEIVQLIAALHRADISEIETRIVSVAERVEFIFEHWTSRYRATKTLDVVSLTLLNRGQQLARELAADDRESVLLHGDLHPGNVLDGGPRGLVAIDPRPSTGDPAFDVVDWVFWNADADHWQTRSHNLAPACRSHQNACGRGVSHSRRYSPRTRSHAAQPPPKSNRYSTSQLEQSHPACHGKSRRRRRRRPWVPTLRIGAEARVARGRTPDCRIPGLSLC